MKSYVGTKRIEAREMNLGNYNEYRGWRIPENEDPRREGYLVRYADGYESWSPKEQFLEAYREIVGLTYGIAVELMKLGKKLARRGWNGKGMFVVYQKGYPLGIPCNKQTAEAWGMEEGQLFICNPYLQIRNADGSHSMWAPSVGDSLAEDWYVVE